MKLILLNNRLQEIFNREIAMVTMFRYTTIHTLEEYLNREEVMESPGVDKDTLLEIEESLEQMDETMTLMGGLMEDDEAHG